MLKEYQVCFGKIAYKNVSAKEWKEETNSSIDWSKNFVTLKIAAIIASIVNFNERRRQRETDKKKCVKVFCEDDEN